MKTRGYLQLFVTLALLAGVHQATAQQITITPSPNGSLSWSGAALGTTSQVQQAYSLVGSGWTNLQSIRVTNNTMTAIVPTVSTSSPSVFYRVSGTPAPVIALKYTSGPSGSSNMVTGLGFRPTEQIAVSYHDLGRATMTANSSGSASTSFTIPTGEPPGTNSVTATGVSSGLSASASFDQTPLLALTPDSGPPGASVTAQANGFLANEQVDVYYNGFLCAAMTANASGSASTLFTIPNGEPTGTNTVTATGVSSGATASTSFDQTPLLVLAPNSGPVGASVVAQVSGFLADEQIKVYYDGVLSATMTANASGNASAAFIVPSAEPTGTNIVNAVGFISGLNASAAFYQTPLLLLTPNSGPPGTKVTAQVSGFPSPEQFDIYYDGVYQTSTVVEGSGTASFTVPAGKPSGNEIVTLVTDPPNTNFAASAIFDQTAGLVLTPNSGPVGTKVTAQASGFLTNEQIQVYYNGVLSATTTANTSGNASIAFTVPSGGLTNIVSALGVTSGLSASAPFKQTGGLLLTPTSGPPGTNVTAQASGFFPDEQIDVYYDTVLIATLTANASGYASTSFTVPAGEPTGTNTVTATGVTSGLSASAPFVQTRLVAALALTPNSGPPGSNVTVQVSGFLTNEQINIYYDGVLIGSTFANDFGSASAVFAIPSGEPVGNYDVTATGVSSGDSASAAFDQRLLIVLTPNSGRPGTSVTVQFNGFLANEIISVYYDSVLIGGAETNSTSGSIMVTIPSGQPTGTNTVKAVGEANGLSGSVPFDQTP